MPTSTSSSWPSPKRQLPLFDDRVDAGRQLAKRLEFLRSAPIVVLGLPRGGVPVAEQVATALGAPLDVILVRKLGVPFQHELAMGAIGENGVRVVNEDVVRETGVSERGIDVVEQREAAELERRAARYRQARRTISLKDKIAVIIDDGIATGATARAACQVARAAGASRIVLAVPVAPPGWTRSQADADELVCLQSPDNFFGVGQFYRNFDAVDDGDVVASLQRARNTDRSTASDAATAGAGEVLIDAGDVRLQGQLTLPDRSSAIVLFAHGSGSSHHSPRNRYVARVLNEVGLATLLFDLLTSQEEMDRAKTFDIELLAHRLAEVTAWVRQRPGIAGLPVCYFGASTGAAAALQAAASPGSAVAAVVSRGGRPDLAGRHLEAVRAPTLLIVGGADDVVLDLNRQALRRLHCASHLAVIPGATHLFEEPGTLAAAALAARDWFLDHVGEQASGGRRD